jgi:hypothetical protein
MMMHCAHCGADVACKSFRVVACCPRCGTLLDDETQAGIKFPPPDTRLITPGTRKGMKIPLKLLGALVVLLLTYGTADVMLWMRDPVGLRIWVELLYGGAWLVLAEGFVALVASASLVFLLFRKIYGFDAKHREILGTAALFVLSGLAEALLGLHSSGLMSPWRGNPSPLLISGAILVTSGLAMTVVSKYRRHIPQ